MDIISIKSALSLILNVYFGLAAAWTTNSRGCSVHVKNLTHLLLTTPATYTPIPYQIRQINLFKSLLDKTTKAWINQCLSFVCYHVALTFFVFMHCKLSTKVNKAFRETGLKPARKNHPTQGKKNSLLAYLSLLRKVMAAIGWIISSLPTVQLGW